MKKTIFQILSAICLLGFSFSCSMDECGGSKDRFLKNYHTLMDDIEDSGYDKEHKKWNTNDDKFQTYVKECYETYEDDLTNRETREFWDRATKYYFKKFANNIDLKLEGKEIGKLIGDNLTEVSTELGDAFKNIDVNIDIDEKEIEEFFDELGGDLEKLGKKWGKKIEQILEKEK